MEYTSFFRREYFWKQAASAADMKDSAPSGSGGE